MSKLELVLPTNEDYFLTGNPEITFFNCVYRRYTHFASQLFDVKFDTPIDFGTITELKLPILGDLLHKVYLKFTIPEVNINKEIDKNVIIELKDQLDNLKKLYYVFKDLANNNMSSYVEIMRLEYLNNLTIDTLYQIVNSNTSKFESKVLVINNISYSYNVYLSNSLKNDIFKDVVIKNQQTPTPFTYGNYQTTLTMTKENIQSHLTQQNKEENKNNIFLILESIKDNMERLDKRFITIINKLQDEYDKYLNYRCNFAWVKYLGHNLIDYIELRIGNDTIDKQYGQWINIWWELNGDKYKEDIYYQLIGNTEELNSFNDKVKPESVIYVPIPFYFCNNIGLSLPLLSLQYSDIIIRLKLREFKDVCYSDYTGASLNDLDKHLTGSLLCECYYLDKMERLKFARASHEYLIEQTQFNTETFLLNDKNMHQFNFQHPVKGIVWVLQESKNLLIENNNQITDPFNNLIIPNTTIYNDNILHNELMLENETLENEESKYFSYVIPYHRFDNSGLNGIYSYWYSIYPYEHQPSGSCNMSFIKNNKLLFSVDIDKKVNGENVYLSKEYVLNCYCLNYNILRISNGSGQLVFQ